MNNDTQRKHDDDYIKSKLVKVNFKLHKILKSNTKYSQLEINIRLIE